MAKCVVQLIIVSLTIVLVLSHPQCLDFRPPFELETPLQLCSNYTDFGCCTVEDDLNLLRQFRDFQGRLSPSDWNRCQGYLKELMCQACSPYAAHVYDAERTMRARTFPGLCRDYCLEFVRACGDVIPLLDPTLTGSRLLLHGDVFCQHVALTDVDYCYPDLLTSPWLNGELQIQRDTREGCLCLEPIAENLTSALLARHAGDGTGRLFVAEQPGIVRILYPSTRHFLSPPFLNISSRVKVSRQYGDERGFLGLAFHPHFSDNGRFFVYYTMRLTEEDEIFLEDEALNIIDLDHKIRISEMRVSVDNPNMADPNYEKVLLEIGQPFANHNGGEILFLEDGYLYIFIGDGGAAGDPLNLSQNKQSLLGKVVRLDVDTNPFLPYTIPADNPFVGRSGVRPEIFATGIRNIWRCGVDPGNSKTGEGQGRVLCGDVGQNAHEEVDLLRAGANYGWRSKEAFSCFDEETCEDPIENEELPVHSYPHSVGKSVTGGHFYRGCESPALDGQYIYGDYVSGRLFSLTENEEGGWINKDITLCGNDICFNGLTNDYDVHILSFGQDESGEVYMLTTPSSRPKRPDGRMFKFVDPLRRGNPSDCPSAGRRNRVFLRSGTSSTTSRERQPPESPVQAPTIQQIRVRVCEHVPPFLCHYLDEYTRSNRNP